MNLLRTCFAVSWVSLAAWACSSGSGSAPGGGGGGGAIPIAELPTAFGSAVCDNLGPCCQKAGLSYDASKCKALYTGLLSQFEASVNSGKTKYDANAAGTCLNAIKQSTQSCDLDTSSPACDQVFQGTVPEGGACDNESECNAPAGASTDCDNGVCVVELRGKVGDACKWTCTEEGSSTSCSGGSGTDTGARCYTNDGLYCDSDSGQCQAQIAVGGTGCGFDDEACATGAYCQSDKCEAHKKVGEACTGFNQCVAGAYCDSAGSGNCAAKKPAGADCTDFDECEGSCDAGKCTADDSGLSFFCQ